jgi:hypothetical protein
MNTDKKNKSMLALYKEVLKRPATEEEIATVDSVLADPAGYLTRYVRSGRRAVLSALPAKDPNGKILKDVPPVYKWTVGYGTPVAAFVAFLVDGKLYIGWAKRNEDVSLLKDEAYEQLVKDLNHKSEFFFSVIEKFVKNALLVEKEVFFCKETGKRLAILRALSDKLTLGERGIKSSVSEYVPRDITLKLRRFIAAMEKIYGKKAENVS